MVMLNTYEIHVTVNHKDKEDIQHFINVCDSMGAKPLLLDLHFYKRDDFQPPPSQHLMTSSIALGDYNDAMQYAQHIGTRLNMNGFEVLRIKIETSPSNPELSTRPDKTHSQSGFKPVYHEAHMKVIPKNNQDAPWDAIQDYLNNSYQDICRMTRPAIALPRFSNNTLKDEEGNLSRMFTWRASYSRHSEYPNDKGEYGFSSVIDRSITNIIGTFRDLEEVLPNIGKFQLGKVSREVVVYDSNKLLDRTWAPI